MIYRLDGRFISINLCLLGGAAQKQHLVFKRLSHFALLTDTFSHNFYEVEQTILSGMDTIVRTPRFLLLLAGIFGDQRHAQFGK